MMSFDLGLRISWKAERRRISFCWGWGWLGILAHGRQGGKDAFFFKISPWHIWSLSQSLRQMVRNGESLPPFTFSGRDESRDRAVVRRCRGKRKFALRALDVEIMTGKTQGRSNNNDSQILKSNLHLLCLLIRPIPSPPFLSLLSPDTFWFYTFRLPNSPRPIVSLCGSSSCSYRPPCWLVVCVVRILCGEIWIFPQLVSSALWGRIFSQVVNPTMRLRPQLKVRQWDREV